MMRPGRTNSIVDVPGVLVGQETMAGGSGVTVVLVPGGAVAGVDVSGAAPGTRETDVLEPENLVQQIQGVTLAGGSAFGLDAAGGVARYLEENRRGQPVGEGRVVPIVPGAVIFDLDAGDPQVRPGAMEGYQAARTADGSAPQMGNVGAGTGATAAGFKGGVGSASILLPGGIVLGAIAIVNPAGRAFDPLTGQLYAQDLLLTEDSDFELPGLRSEATVGPSDYSDLFPDDASLAGRNTTIGVIASNARLDKAQCRRVARAAQDGLARAVRPSHTLFDGDTVFALSTGEVEVSGPSQLARLGAAAADVFARAVMRGVLYAQTAYGYRSYRDLFSEGKGSA